MSAKQRADAQAMRRTYARTAGISVDLVTIEFLENEDAIVSAPSRPELPRWTLMRGVKLP